MFLNRWEMIEISKKYSQMRANAHKNEEAGARDSSTCLIEVMWLPKPQEAQEVTYDETFADEMFRLEHEKRVMQCDAFLEFLEGMKGKDLEPYLSDVNLSIGTRYEMAVTIKIPLGVRLQESKRIHTKAEQK